ncbi:MAG TPA: hypothetical protein VFV70_16070 [Hyphomonadaceae bacterium]|nr:hypothetical protein [Hyphomonadaceae bacterium]
MKASAADGLVFQYKGQVSVARAEVWKRLVAIGSWWSDAHTYSGSASNMTIDPMAGGCWCETWPGGEVEHGRVVLAMPGQTLRLSAALGPLQDLAVGGALTVTLGDGATSGATSITMDYKVVGSSLTNLAPLANVIDGVIQEQFDRLIKP